MNHYEILGVGPDATEQQIKEAYRREAMKWHPDRHDGAAAKGEADRRFKDLALAYRTLRSAGARAHYDRQLEQQLHQEYSARQQEQARQQKADSEKTQQRRAKQEQEKPDFADTGPQFEEQTASADDANQMFFEQMLDLASELAGRGFPEFNIFKALVALGCPDALARDVSAAAMQRNGAKNEAKNTDADVAVDGFESASWETLEPYYRAAIEGKNTSIPLSENRRKIAIRQRAGRKKYWFAFATLVLLVGIIFSFSVKSSADRWATLIAIFACEFYIFIFYIISLNAFLKPDVRRYVTEESTKYYLRVFEVMHRAKFEGASIPIRSLQLFGFSLIACVFNYGWLLYRKVYGAAIFFVLAYGVTYVAASMSNVGMYSGAYIFMALGLSFSIGIFGNRLYFNRVQKIFREGYDGETQTVALNRLRKNGGTSSVIGWLVPIFIVGVLAAVALPAYQDYTRRAQVATGFVLGSEAAQKIGDYYVTQNKGPGDLGAAGFSFVPSKAVKDLAFDRQTGILMISFQDGFFGAKSLLLVPTIEDGKVTWLCTSAGIATQHLPHTCRATQDAANARLAAINAEAQSRDKVTSDYAQLLATVEMNHPELNPDSPRYNGPALNWVAARKTLHQEQGQTPTNSLQLAVADYVASQRQTGQSASQSVGTPPLDTYLAGLRRLSAKDRHFQVVADMGSKFPMFSGTLTNVTKDFRQRYGQQARLIEDSQTWGITSNNGSKFGFIVLQNRTVGGLKGVVLEVQAEERPCDNKGNVYYLSLDFNATLAPGSVAGIKFAVPPDISNSNRCMDVVDLIYG